MDSTEDTGVGKVKSNTPLISPHYLLMMAGRMMPLFALFATTILYAHELPTQSYALFQSIWMYVNLVSVILAFGITNVIFSSQADELLRFIKEKRKSIFIFYSVVWIVTITLFAFTSQYYSILLRVWVIIFMMIQASNTITETWLIKNNGEVKYFFINIIYGSAFFVWHFIVMRSGFDIEWLIRGIAYIAFAKFLILILLSLRLRYTNNEAAENAGLTSHWMYNGINDIISILSKWIDKLILIYLLTPAEFAIFFNGSIEIPLLAIFISFTGSLMMVQMARRMRQNESVLPVFRENFLLLSTIIFPVFFFFFFFSYPIFQVIFGATYESSVPVFMITILLLPIRINTYGGILQVLGKGKLVTAGSVLGLILCIILVVVLYPIFGMRGAAMAIVFSTIIQIMYYLWQSKRLLQTSYLQMIPLSLLIIRFFCTGILFWIHHHFLQSFSTVMNLLSGSALILACIVITGNKYYGQIINRKKTL